MKSKKYYRVLNIPLDENDDTYSIVCGIVILIISFILFLLKIDAGGKVFVALIVRLFAVFYTIYKAKLLNRNRFYGAYLH